MKSTKQATLFQSWGNQKKDDICTKDNDNFEKVPVIAGTSRNDLEDNVINLCDSFEDGDDELLCQAEETLNLESNYKDGGHPNHDNIVRNVEYNKSFGTDEENECNISIGADNFTLTQRQSMCKSLPGFDLCAGKMWIYPTNYPVRDYQYNIVNQALFKNTMVTLPTGLGKTFIAAVVMYNYYRWYPQGKVVFMAPTKPLVAQQIEACYNIMGIPQDHTAEMTGSMGPPKREKAWHEKRVFFLTPQVLTNDLSRGSCPAEDVKCLVIDEAHKALGNHAYCQVVRELVKYTENFRVLALSATPGSDIKAVQQVLNNLLISHIEIRTEESIDIKQYSHERKVEKVVVPLGEELTKVKEKYIHIMDVVVSRLKRQGVLYNRDTSSLSKFLILKSRDVFRQNPPERLPRSQYGVVEADYALAMSLYHGFELLQLHGSRSLYNFLEGILSGDKGHGRTRVELTKNADFNEIMALLARRYSNTSSETDNKGDHKKFVTGHPKMEKLQEIVVEHFNKFANQGESATRVMIFSQYRDSVQEITDMLNVHRPLIKVMSFIGQSSAGKATKGFTQKEQLKVMKQFREGGYNTLVSTCVGEEGLDIGDVDLIICFDAHKSPIRLVQRMGRTGRKREGRIVMLVTQGKEEQIYNQSQYSKRSIHKAILNGARSLHFYQHSPRMVPEQLIPKAHKMYITVKESFKPTKKISTEPKADQSKITSLFDNAAKKNEKEDIISAEEFQELQDWIVDDAEIPALPRPHLVCLDKQDNEERNKESTRSTLSLSEWSPWQNTLQHYEKIDHSNSTKHLVQIMEFIQLQQSLDPEDDAYGLEMAAYLNEDDILKQGETETDNILKYCVPNQLEKNTDGNHVSKAKKKLVRKSDVLKEIEEDYKDSSSSDDDLPAFTLSPDTNKTNENVIDMTDNQQILIGLSEDEVKHNEIAVVRKDKQGKSSSNFIEFSKKKSIGSRAKSLERRMSEDILRKSKKRKRSKNSLNNTRVVELIADHDSNDFDDNTGTNILEASNSNETLQNEKVEESKIVQRSRHSDCDSSPKTPPKVINVVVNTNLSKEEFYKISSPPSVEDAVAHCEGLDRSDFLDGMDILDILEESEKENLRKRYNKFSGGSCSSSDKNIEFHIKNEFSWTDKLIEGHYCEEDGFQRFLEAKKQNDILLNKLFNDNYKGSDKTSVSCNRNNLKENILLSQNRDNFRETRLLTNNRHSLTHNALYSGSKDNFKNSSSPDISRYKTSSSKHEAEQTCNEREKDHQGKLSPISCVKHSQKSLLKDLDFPSSGIENQNDSWFGSAEDKELVLACKTQHSTETHVKDLDRPTQVTFTQAMACIHNSNSSESESITGNQRLVPDLYGKCTDNEEFEGSLKTLPTPEFHMQIDEKEEICSTGRFTTKDEEMDHETYQEVNEQSSPNDKENDKKPSNGKEKPIMQVEKIMNDFERQSSDDDTDLPQFDLGFDFDEDIVPPSPNATQQSQKGVSKCISQTFSNRLSHSILNIASNNNGDNVDKTDSKESIKEDINVQHSDNNKRFGSKQCLDFSSNLSKETPVLIVDSKHSNRTHSKIIRESSLDDIPEFSDSDSDFELAVSNDKQSCNTQRQKNEYSKDEKDKDHEEVLKVAQFISSQEDMGEPSFCLMGGDELGDWFDSEPELTEHTDLDNPVQSENVETNKNSSKDGEQSSKQIVEDKPDTLNAAHDNDSEAKVTNSNDDFQDYSEVFNKTKSKLKTPVTKFKARKSVFTADDFSPDPFNDSFEFNDVSYPQTGKHLTILKAKVKPFLVSSSTPKVDSKMQDSEHPANHGSNSPSMSPQCLEQKENQSESESDDSFIIRKKKKPCIIESPCSQVVKEKEVNDPNETVFKTPFREKLQKKKSNLISKGSKKKMSVSFSDDEDFDPDGTTKKQYLPPRSLAVINEDSSDDDFDDSVIRKKRNDKSDTSDKSSEHTSPKQKARKKRGSNPFIEEEAELSEDEHPASSDESEHDLDHYEASFIQDTEQFSQSQGINHTQMQAVYMESVKSPTAPGRFKLQYDYKNTNVFSQIPVEESQYMEDSFCVGEEDDDWLGGYEDKLEPMEVTVMHSDVSLLKTGRTRRQRGAVKTITSGTERERYQGRMKALDKLKSKIAQKNKSKDKTDKDDNEDCILRESRIQRNVAFSPEEQNKRKFHPLSDLESPEIKTKKKRLKTKIFSSSDEEDIEKTEYVASINNNFGDFVNDDFVPNEKMNLTKLKEKLTGSEEIHSNQSDPDLLIIDSDKSKKSSRGVILVDSKEIGGSQDIISDLRFKHGIHVSAAQLPGCDYIISNRMAVDRKQWSEFSNGANREKLTERIRALKDLYDRPVLIVEKDRVKPDEEKHPRPLHWTKYVDKTIAQLLRSSVKVLYTDNQKETATLMSDLCQLEMRKGMGITAQVELNTTQQNKVKFFASIPKLSYIHALNLAHSFKSVAEFMKSSIQEIQSKGQMSESRAVDVYKFVRRQFDADMLSKQ